MFFDKLQSCTETGHFFLNAHVLCIRSRRVGTYVYNRCTFVCDLMEATDDAFYEATYARLFDNPPVEPEPEYLPLMPGTKVD